MQASYPFTFAWTDQDWSIMMSLKKPVLELGQVVWSLISKAQGFIM